MVIKLTLYCCVLFAYLVEDLYGCGVTKFSYKLKYVVESTYLVHLRAEICGRQHYFGFDAGIERPNL